MDNVDYAIWKIAECKSQPVSTSSSSSIRSSSSSSMHYDEYCRMYPDRCRSSSSTSRSNSSSSSSRYIDCINSATGRIGPCSSSSTSRSSAPYQVECQTDADCPQPDIMCGHTYCVETRCRPDFSQCSSSSASSRSSSSYHGAAGVVFYWLEYPDTEVNGTRDGGWENTLRQ